MPTERAGWTAGRSQLEIMRISPPTSYYYSDDDDDHYSHYYDYYYHVRVKKCTR